MFLIYYHDGHQVSVCKVQELIVSSNGKPTHESLREIKLTPEEFSLPLGVLERLHPLVDVR